MRKSSITSTLTIIKYDTAVNIGTVIDRLEENVNKQGSGDLLPKLEGVTNEEELKNVIGNIVKHDFVYFWEFPHHKLLTLAHDGEKRPKVMLYTIGNPLIAQGILEYNTLAAYCIPPRLLVLEKPNQCGTTVLYYQPSSIMSVPCEKNHPTLQATLEDLDRKLECLVVEITAE